MGSWLTDAIRIDHAAIERLIENGVSESQILDFKREMPLSRDKEKDDVLRDITAFANAEGGRILVGVDEKDDKAIAIPGIEIAVAADIEARITSMMRDRIEPPAPVDFQQVKMGDGRVVLAIHARKSLNPPHAVVTDGKRLIYRRTGKRKDAAKVSEIRDMVLSGATMRERMAAFHRERLEVVLSGGDGRAAPFEASRGLILGHILPLREFNEKKEVLDARRLVLNGSSTYKNLLKDMFSDWFGQASPLLDHFGYVQSEGVQSDSGIDRYIRLFDWGGIELAQGLIIENHHIGFDFLWPSVGNFQILGCYINSLIRNVSDENIQPPYAGFISAAGVNNVFVKSGMVDHPSSHNPAQGRILTDQITFGPVIFDAAPLADARNPLSDGLMDRLWQAAGKHYRPSEDQSVMG